ncbi:hypothetical protein D5S17_02815 [Pseudonocardiaceae bacterium YIM PH 21723]|nr:hypothetical protein D5S17_02815 [Pseudonocardiaceae bacterium YIM PH 21723]
MAGYLLRNESMLREAAAPTMAELGQRTRETIHLTMPDGAEVVLLDKVDSTQAVRNVTWVGGRAPIQLSASGLALLAHGVEAPVQVDQALLVETRERGYAINIGMWRDEVSAVAAAIRRPDGVAVAALSISLPTYRLSEELRTRYGVLVRDGALAVSRLRFGA